MAVNVSTITSVCLYCKTDSIADERTEFHEIYDEVGQELQLPTLVETFFHIEVRNDCKQYLCDDCVNRLIELYDLEEHAKEEGVKTKANLQNFKDVKYVPEIVKMEDIQNNESDFQFESVKEEKAGRSLKGVEIVLMKGMRQKGSNATLQNFTNSIPKNDIQRIIEHNEKVMDRTKTAISTQQQNLDDNQCTKNVLNKNFIIRSDSDVSEDFNSISISTSPVVVTNCNEPECNEHIEFVEEEVNQNLDIEVMVTTGTTNSSEESKLKTCGKDDQISEMENETNDSETKNSSQNNVMEDYVYEEEELDESLHANEKNKFESETNQQINIEDVLIEEIEDIYYDDDDDAPMSEETEITSDKKVKNVNSNVTEVELQNEMESPLFIEDDEIDMNEIIENNHNDGDSNDVMSLEEYLIEEINCSQEYDSVDLNEYLDKVIITKFQDLQLNWKTECKLCLNNFPTFEELLRHSCITDFEDEQHFCCIIKDCEETVNSLSTLARHLILNHYDQFESIPIYGKCPDCQKTFSNIIDFNKHSCCRNIKRKAGSPNYCKNCDMDFQSLKRYVFHMQFHLTCHRPKVCLLCGDLFNNSNDFFEHTQYHHIPQAAMACTKCDRFFKEKDVFDSHMELHEESKYQYGCTLCPKKYTNKFGLTQHMDIYHNNKSNIMQCSYCEKEFVNKASYNNHLKSHASDVQVETYVCSTCGLITNNSESIKSHIESDKESSCFSSPIEEKTLGLGYTCENCSLDFLTIKQLKEHRLSKSHSDDLYHCSICRQRFKNLRRMRNHSIIHKDYKEHRAAFPIKRYFVCNIGNCQEFYPIWTSLYYHKKRPHKTDDNPPDEFKCQFCQQLCSSKMSLAVHVARSHNNANVKCPHCKRSIKSQKLLQMHIDKYHTPVVCNICFKKFKHRRNLESHNNLVHLNIKRYFCKYCDKGYFHKSERDIHEKKVHPEVSYKCDICNFATNYQTSLEVHMDKHNNQLKFKCTICNKAFGRKQLLQCHLKRHLNKKDFSCAKYLNESGCEATFLTYNLLKRHIQTKHQDSNYCRNMLKEREHKQSSSKVLQIENISYEILNSEDDCRSDKSSSKTSTCMSLNETDFEEDAIELIFENDDNQ